MGSFAVEGSPRQRFHLKLTLLRDKLRVWNKEVFGNVGARKESLLEEICGLDKKEESVGLSVEDSAARQCLKEDFEWVLDMEEVL